MTTDEAYNQLYFGIELYLDGNLAVSQNIMYRPSEDSINEKPYTCTVTDAQGRTVTLRVDGSYDTVDQIYKRECTVTASERFRAYFKSSLNQVITLSDGDYGIELDNRETGHLSVVSTNPVQYDIRQDLIDLWQSTTVADKENFGGKVRVFVRFFTHLILRDPDNGNLIMRGNTNKLILRDD